MNSDTANSLAAAGIFAVAAAIVTWQARQPARNRRRGIRQLEAYANHPAHRTRRNQQWKEDTT